ncbi:MAG: hypothetical protein KIS78_23260 [Labilithrix sp.]|nr:hypothetical protein [Labilithrix sp.]MCW5835339.1 hypothetical protein [Labilithrix sp.]
MTNDAPPALEIEPASMKSSGRCACCGKSRRTAWGFVYRDGGPLACYFVEWTLGRSDCAARFDVVVGSWFDGTTEDDRAAVSLEYRLLETGPSFSVVDADGRPAAEVGRATRSGDVQGTPLADEVMRIAGAILEADARVRELAARAPA